MRQVFAMVLMLACLTVGIGGQRASAGEGIQAYGLELLRENVGYIERNYAQLRNTDAKLEATDTADAGYDGLLAKQFEIIQRIIELEQRSRTLIKDYELHDNPYVHVGDSNREFRLRIPGTDLTKLQRLSRDRKTSMTQLIMNALQKAYPETFGGEAGDKN